MATSSQDVDAADDGPRLEIRPGSTVAKASAIMAGMILLSRFTGLARMMVVSHLFGRTAETDCYTAAFNIPDVIYFLISGGALATGFVPVFSEYLIKGAHEQARRTFRSMMTLLGVCLLVAISLCFAFAPQLVALTQPGWRGNPEMVNRTAEIARILLPAQFFFVLSSLFTGTLNSLRYFMVPQLQPIIYNFGIILGGWLLGPRLGVSGLAWGALTGAAVGCCVFQVPLLIAKGLSFRPLWDTADQGVRKIVSLVMPIVLGLSLTQVTVTLLPRSFSSILSTGSTTAIEFANRLMQMPVAVFASGMAVALLPSMSVLAAEGRLVELRQGIAMAFRVALLLVFPAAALLMVLGVPIIDLLLEHGNFGSADTAAVAQALLFYSLGIPAMGTQQVVSRGFYAMQDTRTPLLIGLVQITVWCVASWLLVPALQHAGLALSSSLALLVTAVLLVTLLTRKLDGLDGATCWKSGLSCFGAAVGCAIIALGAYRLTESLISGSSLAAQLAHVVIPLGVATVAYALLLTRLPVPEARLVWDKLAKRLRPSA